MSSYSKGRNGRRAIQLGASGAAPFVDRMKLAIAVLIIGTMVDLAGPPAVWPPEEPSGQAVLANTGTTNSAS
jgi:hypothetical protein